MIVSLKNVSVLQCVFFSQNISVLQCGDCLQIIVSVLQCGELVAKNFQCFSVGMFFAPQKKLTLKYWSSHHENSSHTHSNLCLGAVCEAAWGLLWSILPAPGTEIDSQTNTRQLLHAVCQCFCLSVFPPLFSIDSIWATYCIGSLSYWNLFQTYYKILEAYSNMLETYTDYKPIRTD